VGIVGLVVTVGLDDTSFDADAVGVGVGGGVIVLDIDTSSDCDGSAELDCVGVGGGVMVDVLDIVALVSLDFSSVGEFFDAVIDDVEVRVRVGVGGGVMVCVTETVTESEFVDVISTVCDAALPLTVDVFDPVLE
jgi:hypothetical protein